MLYDTLKWNLQDAVESQVGYKHFLFLFGLNKDPRVARPGTSEEAK